MKDTPNKVLVVVAHPDDAEVIAGSTIARWTNEGSEINLLVCTDGGKGSSSNTDTESIKQTRSKEQTNAAKALGIKQVDSLGYPDCEINCDSKLKGEIVKHIRMNKPEVVITFDPTFIYSTEDNYINHQDHRAVGQATIDAVFPLARDAHSFPEHINSGMQPHKVSTLLLFNLDQANFYVASEKYFDQQLQAIFEHKSQFEDKPGFTHSLRDRQKRIAKDTEYDQCEGFVRLDLD